MNAPPASQRAVCVIDDDAAVGTTLKLLFQSKNIPFLAFATAAEFYAGIEDHDVGCLLLDYRLGGPAVANGLDLLHEMRDKGIHLPVIILTGFADVPMAVKAMKAGVVDLIEKPYENADLLERVEVALARAERIRQFHDERAVVEAKISVLTPREIEVLDHMVSGFKNRKIAEMLGITGKTLDIHRANILRKMHTKTVADLVRWRLLSRADEHGVMPIIVRP